MAEMTPARRSVAAALLFLGAAVLAGISPGEEATAYRVLGLVEGMLALLLTFVLLERGVWERPPTPLGWVAIAYGALASGQLLTLLLPGGGVLQWIAVLGTTVLAWAALGVTSRRRLIGLLAGLAVLLALLKFSVIPVVWQLSGPAPGSGFGLGNALEPLRRLVVDHRPTPRSGQLLGVAAAALWALATRLLWRPGGEEEDWLAAVPVGIRQRLAPPEPRVPEPPTDG